MVTIVRSSAIVGIDAYPVHIEVDVSNGLPMVGLVGLPADLVKESRERVRSAIINSGFLFPKDKRVMIHVRPLVGSPSDDTHITSTSTTRSTVKRITIVQSSDKCIGLNQNSAGGFLTVPYDKRFCCK